MSGIATRPRPALFQAIKTSVYPYGRPTDSTESALLPSLTLSVPANPCEAYTFISPSVSSLSLSRLLLGQYRFSPPKSISWPFARGDLLDQHVGAVKFENEVESFSGGEFTDFTERYFAKREPEDGVTLEQDLLAATHENEGLRDDVIQGLELSKLLNLPVRALSNGQRRRARIAKILMKRLNWIILEECFAGLDPASREHLADLLKNLHRNGSPFISLIQKPHDPIPPFITHVGLLSYPPKQGATLTVHSVSEYNDMRKVQYHRHHTHLNIQKPHGKTAEELVHMSAVNVIYEKQRHVLKNIDWVIRSGEKWCLKGHNGSGKTTLLAMLMGDHPKSYGENITIFGQPRASQATVFIQQNLGHLSPELSRSFPRRLSVLSTLSSGFYSVFSHRSLTSPQREILHKLLSDFSHIPSLNLLPLLDEPLNSLPVATQQFVLFLRAVIGRPRLLVLDEPFAGMDAEIVDELKVWLRKWEGAVVLVSHKWEEEWPEDWERQTLELKDGTVIHNDSKFS